ncbi:MAG: extracellular solute-binding protein [Sinobacteraceae bacterium]|nr:extracellular solute-binding protein [Nevskiaceae bacterium]
MFSNSLVRRMVRLAAGFGMGCAAAAVAAADVPVLRVAYAGSMGAVMDQGLGPSFDKSHGTRFEGIGQGAYGLARLLASKQMRADVFVSITSGPVDILRQAGLLDRVVPVASTRMVIVYSDRSRFAAQFQAAAAGKIPWYTVLEQEGVRFGRTDPATDPQGRNIVFTLRLAERYYRQPGLAEKILGPIRNPQQIFTEPSLLSRLEAGQIDAASGYRSAALSHHLPFIELPDEINLSNPALMERWYRQAEFSLSLPNGKTETLQTQPLVFYAGVLSNAENPTAAQAFVDFLASPDGQRIFAEFGYDPPKGGAP